MTTDNPLTELKTDVHIALKNWHSNDGSASSSLLTGLRRFRQLQSARAVNDRQAINKLLLEGLDKLEAEDSVKADLLRGHFLDSHTIHTLANRNNIAQPTVYRWQRKGIARLAEILYEQELYLLQRQQANLESRLEAPNYTQLVGVEEPLALLMSKLTASQAPWLISIEGMGGLGKTAIADALSRQLIEVDQFADFAWVSAKQEDFFLGMGKVKRDKPALDTNGLLEALLHQLNPGPPMSGSADLKLARLTSLLKQKPTLIVIDNLETALDHQSLLPLLRQLANPSKILLTSRTSLHTYGDVFCYKLPPLSQSEALNLIRQQAQLRGIPALLTASEAQLQQIYQLVGGNALALKLVIGQVYTLALPQVLERLAEAQGKDEEALYSYLYWYAWHNLNPTSQQLLLTMPLVQQGNFEQLLAASGLDKEALTSALHHLHTLSLVQIGGNLENRRYSIHRLTETFLLYEALQWQKSN